MTTFTWSFPQFDVAKAEDGLTDVVKTIHWRYDAKDGAFNAGAYGSVGLGAPDSGNFIPFANLTEAWAVETVSASVDVPAMDINLAKNIANQINPPIVPMNPPFTQNG
jgi:hypothetical protein